MKSEWKTKQLSNIADFNPRESLSKGIEAKKISMDMLQPYCRDVPTYEVTAFTGGTKFRNGDTIMARITPCLENGKTAQINILDDNEVGFGSTEYIVIRAKEGVSDPDYIYYLVRSPLVREPAIKSMVGSSGRQRVQTDVVQRLEVQVPPLEEQRKVSGVLRVLDDKIKLNNEINKNLEQQAQAIFKYLFVDFEPFGNNMPDNWTMGIINDLAEEIICGKTPSTKIKEYYGSDIPFITIPDMHGNTYAVTTERYLSQYGANSQPKKSLPKNSTCISCIGTAGLVTLVATESQTNQQINSIIPKHDYSPYYIYLLMQTMSKVINKLGQSGSTIVNLNKAQFGKMQAIIPSITVMKSFDEVVSPIFEMILERQMENARLVSLRDILLPKLMSGEFDVSDIDL